MPTKQQLDLAKSLPHQDWANINLSDYRYVIRRSYRDPRDPKFTSEPFPGEDMTYNRPTPALQRCAEIARDFRMQDYSVIKDEPWGVYTISSSPTFFYLFIEYIPRSSVKNTATIGMAPTTSPDEPKASSENLDFVPVPLPHEVFVALSSMASLKETTVGVKIAMMVANVIDGKPPLDDWDTKMLRVLVEYKKRDRGEDAQLEMASKMFDELLSELPDPYADLD
ncbi:MAG: hypothetical protein ABJA67_10055 [Chthonomonadales bacterium]